MRVGIGSRVWQRRTGRHWHESPVEGGGTTSAEPTQHKTRDKGIVVPVIIRIQSGSQLALLENIGEQLIRRLLRPRLPFFPKVTSQEHILLERPVKPYERTQRQHDPSRCPHNPPPCRVYPDLPEPRSWTVQAHVQPDGLDHACRVRGMSDDRVRARGDEAVVPLKRELERELPTEMVKADGADVCAEEDEEGADEEGRRGFELYCAGARP